MAKAEKKRKMLLNTIGVVCFIHCHWRAIHCHWRAVWDRQEHCGG